MIKKQVKSYIFAALVSLAIIALFDVFTVGHVSFELAKDSCESAVNAWLKDNHSEIQKTVQTVLIDQGLTAPRLTPEKYKIDNISPGKGNYAECLTAAKSGPVAIKVKFSVDLRTSLAAKARPSVSRVELIAISYDESGDKPFEELIYQKDVFSKMRAGYYLQSASAVAWGLFLVGVLFGFLRKPLGQKVAEYSSTLSSVAVLAFASRFEFSYLAGGVVILFLLGAYKLQKGKVPQSST